MTMRNVLISTLSAIFIVGCGSKPPAETHSYLLRPVSTHTSEAAAPKIGLGGIAIAPYLDHKGIVLETQHGEIHTARHNTWAEPLDYSIRRYLQVALSNEIQQPIAARAALFDGLDHVLYLSINQLHGSESGYVRLVAAWGTRPGGGGAVTNEHEFSATERMQSDGYSELVKAHGRLLDALAADIAARIQ